MPDGWFQVGVWNGRHGETLCVCSGRCFDATLARLRKEYV